MPFETFNSPPEAPPPQPAVHRCEKPNYKGQNYLPVERRIGAGSIWRCDFCETRWEFGQYAGWRFPITRFFRFLLWIFSNPFWIFGAFWDWSEWSKPRSKLESLLEWGAVFVFLVVGPLVTAGL